MEVPQDVSAEQSILGSILIDNSLAASVAEGLAVDDLYLPFHRDVYQTILELLHRGDSIDPVTINSSLGSRNGSASVTRIQALSDGQIRLKNVDDYLKIVAEKAFLRRLADAGRNIADEAFSSDAPAEVILERAKQSLYELASASGLPPEPEPRPLPSVLRPVETLQPEMIPEPLRPWLVDIAERMSCPLEYGAVAAITALGSLNGNRIVLKPKSRDPWIVATNLYAMIVAPPGAQKSPAVSEALMPIKAIERSENEAFQKRAAEMKIDRECREAEKKTLRAELEKSFKVTKKSDGSRADREAIQKRLVELEQVDDLKPRRVLCADATPEKLVDILKDTPRGILLNRDELAGLISTLDRAGYEPYRALLLEAANGLNSFTVDRIGRGHTHIETLTLSILGTTQPSVIAPFLRAAKADGLPARFSMAVYPDPIPIYEYVNREPRGVDDALRLFRAFYELDPAAEGFDRLTDEAGGRFFMKFDPDAQEFFQNWLTNLENYLRGEAFVSNVSHFLKSHVSKYSSLFSKLAIIFQIIDYVAGVDLNKAVSLKNADLAARWCILLRSHAERLYGMEISTESEAARLILAKIRDGAIGQNAMFTARDIYRNCWSGLKDRKTVEAALEILTKFGWLKEFQVPTDGRWRVEYALTERAKGKIFTEEIH